jgi:hypothetical protein
LPEAFLRKCEKAVPEEKRRTSVRRPFPLRSRKRQGFESQPPNLFI